MIRLDSSACQLKLKEISVELSMPLFAQYSPNIDAIKKIATKYKGKRNIILIGNGGSITSFYYYCTALGTAKNVFIISTMEPDFLCSVKKKCNKQDTVIIAVSKSGDTVGVIEELLYFFEYPNIIIVTESRKSAIKQIQEQYSFEFIEHPPIGGRFSGFTPSGLLPAAIAGIDINGIWEGAKRGYARYSQRNCRDNPALLFAQILYELDKKGYCEIFMPIYSSKLLGSKDIVVQLVHESVGKEGKGQTVLASFAPESQHNTNQRFFGGRHNMLGCFVVVDEQEHKYEVVKVPEKIKQLQIREGTLADIDDRFYAKALLAEFNGTREDAISKKIPNVTLHIPSISPSAIGNYLAFWHYATVFLCILNRVDPYNQPQVESSKKISFEMRKKR